MNSFCNISTFFSVKGFFQNEFKIYFNKNKSENNYNQIKLDQKKS